MRHQHFRRVYIDLIDCALQTGDLDTARALHAAALPLYPADERSGEHAELLAAGSAVAAADGDSARAQDLLRRAIGMVEGDPAHAANVQAWRERLAAPAAADDARGRR